VVVSSNGAVLLLRFLCDLRLHCTGSRGRLPSTRSTVSLR
jgi:hypothetical protein